MAWFSFTRFFLLFTQVLPNKHGGQGVRAGESSRLVRLHLTSLTEMDDSSSCPGSSAPHRSPTHPWSCLLSLLCAMDTVLTAQTCVLTTASIMSPVWCSCARTNQMSESQGTCSDGEITCRANFPHLQGGKKNLQCDFLHLSSHRFRYGLACAHSSSIHLCPEKNCWPKTQQCEHLASPPAVGLTRVLLPVPLQINLPYSRDCQARWGLPGASVSYTPQLETLA